MGEVVRLPTAGAAETLEEFIAREGNVSTMAVAARFGWDMAEARRRLNALLRIGVVRTTDFRWSGDRGGGKSHGWEMTGA